MDADIVNLRRARKNKARRSREAEAAANRAAHGAPKAAREQSQAQRNLEASRLDGHRRDPADAP